MAADGAFEHEGERSAAWAQLTPRQQKALAALLDGLPGYSSAGTPPISRDDLHDRELDRLDG